MSFLPRHRFEKTWNKCLTIHARTSFLDARPTCNRIVIRNQFPGPSFNKVGTVLAAVCRLLLEAPECRGKLTSSEAAIVASYSCWKMRILVGRLIGVCSLLTSMQNLGSSPVFGVGSARWPDGPAERSRARVLSDSSQRRRCRSRRSEDRRERSLRNIQERHGRGWNDFLRNTRRNVLSREENVACVSTVTCCLCRMFLQKTCRIIVHLGGDRW